MQGNARESYSLNNVLLERLKTSLENHALSPVNIIFKADEYFWFQKGPIWKCTSSDSPEFVLLMLLMLVPLNSVGSCPIFLENKDLPSLQKLCIFGMLKSIFLKDWYLYQTPHFRFNRGCVPSIPRKQNTVIFWKESVNIMTAAEADIL